MADYVVALDDSGGIEPLVKGDGSFIKGDKEITVLSAIFIRSYRLKRFNQQWNQLRADIQSELHWDYPPPIHMRLMWGKDVKKMYRKKPNPYVHATFEQIQGWVRNALEIIYGFHSDPKMLNYFTIGQERKVLAGGLFRYFSNPKYRAELEFIRAHSRGNRMHKHYINRIASPLLTLFAQLLPRLDESMRGSRKTLALEVDQFSDSHGIDAVEVIEAINDLGGLTQIESVTRVLDADEAPLTQAADVISYVDFRGRMIQSGFINHDEAMAKIVQPFTHTRFTKADLDRLIERRHSHWKARVLTIHYAIARQQIAKDNPEFTATHMVSVQEFLDRAIEAMQKGEVGVLILKDWSVCKRYYEELIK